MTKKISIRNAEQIHRLKTILYEETGDRIKWIISHCSEQVDEEIKFIFMTCRVLLHDLLIAESLLETDPEMYAVFHGGEIDLTFYEGYNVSLDKVAERFLLG